MLSATCRTSLLVLLLLLLLPAPSRAQTWQQALNGHNNQPTREGTSVARATTVDSNGNVLVSGSFTGEVTFGDALLISAGQEDLFLAKWDAARQQWAWAVRAGGTGSDLGLGIGVSGNGVYVTGSFASGQAAYFAGQPLTGSGDGDVFVAKYVDQGSSVTNGWATSGGGTGSDAGQGIAVSGSNVFVTGYFAGVGPATIAGATLTSSGGAGMFVAKFVDKGTSVASGWATAGGGLATAKGQGIAVNGSQLYVTGGFQGDARIGSTLLSGAGESDLFVARYTDQGPGVAADWAVSGGGTGNDYGQGIAVNGPNIYVTGSFDTNTNARIAGTLLLGSAWYSADAFVAKYVDTGTGASNGWATSGGGGSEDRGLGIAASGTSVYTTGFFGGITAEFAGQVVTGYGGYTLYVAKYVDLGTRFENNWAATSGSKSGGFGYGLATQGNRVYVAALTASTPVAFGPLPRLLAPANSAVLGCLAAISGEWQQIEGPLQGEGSSVTLGTAADARGNVYVTGYFTGTVGFGNTRLTSAGDDDIFLAKWSATQSRWIWATSGGGAGEDIAYKVAVQGDNVYVVGHFGVNATLAGQTVVSAGNLDVFLAKYTDEGASFRDGWVVRGGGTGVDSGVGVAVSGANVYVTGSFTSSTGATFAAIPLPGAGSADAFVAKYIDEGATFGNGWAVSAGGSDYDFGQSVTSAGPNVYVTGAFTSGASARIADIPLAGVGGLDAFIAKYTDEGSRAGNGWAVSAGGTGRDNGQDIAVSESGVYVAGNFYGGTNARVAGVTLAGVSGSQDVFVARYTDLGTNASDNWATSGGGPGEDFCGAIAVNGPNVYLTGSFASRANVIIAGRTLTGAGNDDLFVAKYLDQGNSVANGWATSGGGTSYDYGSGVAVNGRNVYLGGTINPRATFGNLTLTNGRLINFLGQLSDGTFLRARGPAPLSSAGGLAPFPNPVRPGAILGGFAPGASVQLLDPLGRLVASIRADATGVVALPASLPAGVYLVRSGNQAVRVTFD